MLIGRWGKKRKKAFVFGYKTKQIYKCIALDTSERDNGVNYQITKSEKSIKDILIWWRKATTL